MTLKLVDTLDQRADFRTLSLPVQEINEEGRKREFRPQSPHPAAFSRSDSGNTCFIAKYPGYKELN
jgi:hypothetical protein